MLQRWEKGKHHTEGVHVAGTKCAPTTTRSGREEYYMWSVSTEGCNCLRDPDTAFLHFRPGWKMTISFLSLVEKNQLVVDQ